MSSTPTKRLLVTFPPKPDESFLGYIVRLSERNYYEKPHWIFQAAGINDPSNCLSSLLSRKDFDLCSMADTVGSTIGDLASMVYPPVAIRGQRHMHRVFGMPVSKHLVRVERLKFCPACLQESAHMRRVWDLVPVTACPTHRQLLIDACPSCGKAIRWNRKKLAFCRCGFDFRQSDPVSIPEEELGLAHLIYRACGLSAPEAAPADAAIKNPLHGLGLDELSSAIIFIADQLLGDKFGVGIRLLHSSTNVELHGHITKAYKVFEAWPHGFYRFLDSLREHESRSNQPQLAGLQKDFGYFYRSLYKFTRSSVFCSMQKMFEAYVKERWSGGLLNSRYAWIPKKVLNNKKYLSMAEVSKILKITENSIKRLIMRGLLKGVIRNRGKAKLILIERESLVEFQKLFDNSMNRTQVARLLNVHRSTIVELINRGILHPFLYNPDGARNEKCLFENKEIKLFLSKIEKCVRKPCQGPATEEVDMFKAVCMLSTVKYTIPRLVQAMLEGVIHPCGFREGDGLNRIVFDKEVILGVLRSHQREIRGESYSLEEAAKLMKFRYEDLIQLSKSGLLLTKKTIVNGNPASITDVNSIKRFFSEYAPNASIARDLKVSPKKLIKIMLVNNITPVTGRHFSANLPYLWRRADLKRFNLRKLVSAYNEEWNIKRKRARKPRLLTAIQVMEMIDIKRCEYNRILKQGLLIPYHYKTRIMGRGKKLLFTSSEILRYKSRSLATDIVSAREAAAMIGENLSCFYRNWVRNGRLKTVEFDVKQGKYFFNKKDVQTLAEFKNSCVSGSETAKIVGVQRTAIMKWTKTGKLIPVSGPGIDDFGCYRYLRSDVEQIRKERMKPLTQIA